MVINSIEKSLPRHTSAITNSFKEAIASGTDIYLVGNRLVEALPGVTIQELKPQVINEQQKDYPAFENQSRLGKLIHLLRQHPLPSLSKVRRQDTDFMITGDLNELATTLNHNGLTDITTLHNSLNDQSFQLIEIADPNDNSDGVITIFASGHPNSYRETRGSNLDLIKSQLQVVGDKIELSPTDQTASLIGDPPELKLNNIDDLDPTSPLAADITMRFFRHATTIRVDGQPINIKLTNQQQDFLLRTLVYQYSNYLETEDPTVFRRLYELELCKLALQDQGTFTPTHPANAILYQAWIHTLQNAGSTNVSHIHFDRNYSLRLAEMTG